MRLLDIFAVNVNGRCEGPVDLSATVYLSWMEDPAAYIGIPKEFTLVDEKCFKFGITAEDGRYVAGMFKVAGYPNFSSVGGVGWSLVVKPLKAKITQKYMVRGGNGEVDIDFSYPSQ